MVAAIYDKAFYYTRQEMADRGYSLDVPSIVGQPQIRIFLKCGSSELEQVAITKYRIPCLKEMGHPLQVQTNHGEIVEVRDVVRSLHGDKPAQQLECGQSKGGTYPCVSRDADSRLFDDLVHCFHSDLTTLSDRCTFMLAGCMWKQKHVKPFNSLTVVQL